MNTMSRAITSPKVRFTVREYLRMAEGGVLDGGRTELVQGRILRVPPQAIGHLAAMSRCAEALRKAARPGDWIILAGTYRLDDHSAPEPDLLWLPVPVGTPFDRWPKPVLLIEIADSSYRRDAGIKLRKYAQHGIADYWIVHLEQNRVEVYRDPQNPTGKSRDCRYASVTHHAPGASIALLARPEVTLQVSDLLP